MYDMNQLDWSLVLIPFLSIFIIIVLLLLMLYLYLKARNFLIILVVYLFSLIIGISSLTTLYIPFTPFIQIFFILFQTVIFILTAITLIDNMR